jgi:hypothetical protein
VRHMRDGLKPFIREFGDRPLDDFQRDEALTMRRSQWSSLWNAIRVAAGTRGLDFYELKHRAIQ